jgi:anthranilate synthase component 2
MQVLIVDNYDSFTYNLAHVVRDCGCEDIRVCRNNRIPWDEVAAFDRIILSPGPGVPSEAGELLPFIRRFAATKSLLGVCLGHQALAEAFGGRLVNLTRVYHGVATPIRRVAEDRIFRGLPADLTVGRYHSWVVSRTGFPASLEITAEDAEGHILALRHRTLDLHGVQFHPESVLTPQGMEIIRNFLYF